MDDLLKLGRGGFGLGALTLTKGVGIPPGYSALKSAGSALTSGGTILRSGSTPLYSKAA